MALNFKENVKNSANTQTSIETIRLLNTALNQLQNIQTELTRAKNRERTAAEQETLERGGVERATLAVSKISPATDPNYEESLRKAQEDLMKRSKTLEKTIISKNRAQTEIALLEKQLIEQEYTVQTTKAALGASGLVYNPLFIDLSAILNQQERLEEEITRTKTQMETESDTQNTAKQQSILQELQINLESIHQKLAQLEARVSKGEALFSEPKLKATTGEKEAGTVTGVAEAIENTSHAPLLLSTSSLLQIFQIVTRVPAFHFAEGHKTYFKRSLYTVHDYFGAWNKAKAVFEAFIAVAWMSLLAPLETILTGTLNRVLRQKDQTHPRTFIQWLNPFTILKAILGFVLGVVAAIISLPFTTLGAVVSLIAGVIAASITLVGFLVLELLVSIIMFPICLIVGSIKTLFLATLHLFKRKA